MKQFLLVYRRSTGRLLECRELGGDAATGFRERVAAEKRESDPDVEVVLLSAASFEALKRTHARYFRNLQGLAEDLTSAFKAG